MGKGRQPQVHPGAAVVYLFGVVPCYPLHSSTPTSLCNSRVRHGQPEYFGNYRADCIKLLGGVCMTFLRHTRPTLPPARANLLFVSALRADELWRHDYGLVKGGERRPPVATGCIFLYASFFGSGGWSRLRAGAGLHPCRVSSTWGEERSWAYKRARAWVLTLSWCRRTMGEMPRTTVVAIGRAISLLGSLWAVPAAVVGAFSLFRFPLYRPWPPWRRLRVSRGFARWPPCARWRTRRSCSIG